MLDTGIFQRFRCLRFALLLTVLLIVARILSLPFYHIPDKTTLLIIAVILLAGMALSLFRNTLDMKRHLATLYEDISRHITPLVDDIEEYVKPVYRQARRVIILIVGSTIVVLGIVMIVTPLPAILVVPLGLSILAIEFAWARRWLKRFHQTVEELRQKILAKIKLGDKNTPDSKQS
jgi:tellurite resistance protein TerC